VGESKKWLQVIPYKGPLPTPVLTDPLIYRWYDIVSVYGTTIKELIHENSCPTRPINFYISLTALAACQEFANQS
jgi:cyanate lyase